MEVLNGKSHHKFWNLYENLLCNWFHVSPSPNEVADRQSAQLGKRIHYALFPLIAHYYCQALQCGLKHPTHYLNKHHLQNGSLVLSMAFNWGILNLGYLRFPLLWREKQVLLHSSYFTWFCTHKRTTKIVTWSHKDFIHSISCFFVCKITCAQQVQP